MPALPAPRRMKTLQSGLAFADVHLRHPWLRLTPWQWPFTILVPGHCQGRCSKATLNGAWRWMAGQSIFRGDVHAAVGSILKDENAAKATRNRTSL